MISTKTLLAILAVALAAGLASGCSSDSTSPTALVDTAPPAVPTGLVATYQHGLAAVKVAWADNLVDADFAGFKMRRVSGDQTTDLMSTPTETTAYLDRSAPSGWSTYYISSVDLVGNESAYATVSAYSGSQPAGYPNPEASDMQPGFTTLR